MVKLLLATVAILFSACGSEYPRIGKGGRIEGNIRYRGSALQAMTRPALRASASIAFPPVGQPNAILIANPPNLVEALADPTSPGLKYELMWLPAYQYKVTAQIVDLDHPTLDYSVLPLGGFPDYCTLPRTNEGLVTVTEDAPTLDTNFVIYDLAGSTDICTQDNCPQPGKSTMRLVVKSSQIPTANDRLRVVLMQTELEAIPTSLRIVRGKDLTFPKVITDNTLPPGSYVLANACLDIGANSGLEKCTDEDFVASYHAPPSPPLEFPANRIVNLTADLDSQTITIENSEDPRALGCP